MYGCFIEYLNIIVVKKQTIYHHAIVSFHVLHFCLYELIKQEKGTGWIEQYVLRRKLVFQKHYRNLAHLSSGHSGLPLPALFALALSYVCIFAIIRRRTAARYRKMSGRAAIFNSWCLALILLFTPLSFFFFFNSDHAVRSLAPLWIIACAGWASVHCPHFHLHAHVHLNVLAYSKVPWLSSSFISHITTTKQT